MMKRLYNYDSTKSRMVLHGNFDQWEQGRLMRLTSQLAKIWWPLAEDIENECKEEYYNLIMSEVYSGNK